MNWDKAIYGFRSFLKLEKSLSAHSVVSYISDVQKLKQYLEISSPDIQPNGVTLQELRNFLQWIHEIGLEATSQARILSGIKSFYKYLILENAIQTSPAELLETPKTRRKLPDVLSVNEIDRIIGQIDLSKPEGERNKAMLETLYGCGLRVSEMINLKISEFYFEEGFVRVVGKGDKERLVPIGKTAIKFIKLYIEKIRCHIKPKKGYEDIVFLSRRGTKLSREMVFMIIKDLTKRAGIIKNVHPHTFRHSFATHLIEGGADLRAVQEMLGHESITTTEIYTHLDREYLRLTIQNYHPRFGV